MHLNNGTHAWILPPRCGTRFVGEYLRDVGLLDGPERHHVTWEDLGDRQLILNVRNPFTRAASMWRWNTEYHKNTPSFEEYIMRGDFPVFQPMFTFIRGIDGFARVDHIVKIENFDEDVMRIGLPKPRIVNHYHVVDDGIEDRDRYNDPKLVDRIREVFAQDFMYFGYSANPEDI